jgi:photosystem II stability/assembly factor-like uncharacterized protein
VTAAHSLYVGTIGEGLFRSLDGGATFKRTCDNMFVECHVRALAVHPHRPRELFLGSEQGLFVSRDGADSWSRLNVPFEGMQIWSIWISPSRPELILAGTCPSRLFRSEDGGLNWTEADVRIRQGCPRIIHTRITTITGDPKDPDYVWAGVEIDGVHFSRDAGKSWQAIGAGLSSQDIHALVVVPAKPGKGRELLAATNNDLNRSRDDGQTWEPLNIGNRMPWSYCRTLAPKAGDPECVFLGNGDFPPGSAGVVGLSRDGGATWELADFPGRANSTIWCFATHPADPAQIYAASVSGQLYRSLDGGRSWKKLQREFGEIRALAWAPS